MTSPSTFPAFLEQTRQRLPDQVVQRDREGQVTREELLRGVADLAEGLRKVGVKPGDRIGVLADNSRRWIRLDLAIQLARAISVPRGTDTPPEEMAQLFRHAEVGIVFAHDARRAAMLEEQRAAVPTMGEIFCIEPKNAPGRTVDDVEALGEGAPSFGEQAARVEADDVATFIYTSGTTGRPKGVVLTHANFAHQVGVLPPLFEMGPDELFLSILPPWHIFERTVEYAALVAGAGFAYTTRRRFKDDLARYRPTFVPSVPRLWEMIYDGVRKAVDGGSAFRRGLFHGSYKVASWRAWGWDRMRGHTMRVKRARGLGLLGEGAKRLAAFGVTALTFVPDRIAHAVVFKRVKAATGGRLRGAISGGGLLPPHIDRFFRTIGVPILIGYGLTETSPVITVRREDRNVLGTIGSPIEGVGLEIRDPETLQSRRPGEVGLVCTRGPHVMRGYYKDDEITRSVIDADGWFNTGDLGYVTEFGDLCFHGRAKETIVLSGGENVEPSHVESAMLASDLIAQAVVVGQDRKTLAALVLPDVDKVCTRLGLAPVSSLKELAARDDVQKLMREETIRSTSGLLPFERISRIALLSEPFDIAGGCLTQTLKLKRHVIAERYAKLIDAAYA